MILLAADGDPHAGHHQLRQTRRKRSQEYVKNSFGQLLLCVRNTERELPQSHLSLFLVGNSSLYKTTHDIHQLVAVVLWVEIERVVMLKEKRFSSPDFLLSATDTLCSSQDIHVLLSA